MENTHISHFTKLLSGELIGYLVLSISSDRFMAWKIQAVGWMTNPYGPISYYDLPW